MSKIYTAEHLSKDIRISEFFKNYVDIPLVLGFCKECPRYNNNHSCPPYNFDIKDFIFNFDYIRITVTKITYADDFRKTPYAPEEIEDILNDTYYYEENLVKHELLKKEDDYKKAISIIGPCKTCGVSCKKEFDRCIHPDNMRYSVEGIGINATKVLEDLFGINLNFIDEKIPEYLKEDEELSNNKTFMPKSMHGVNALLYCVD